MPLGRNRLARRGVIDVAATDVAEAASQSDVLIFATPVDLIVSGVRAVRARVVGYGHHRCRQHESSDLSRAVVRIAKRCGFRRLTPTGRFGTASWEHAYADLWRTNLRGDSDEPGRAVASRRARLLTVFWQKCGMTVIELSPEAHDRAVAQTSHVPHVVASALARTLTNENRAFVATGFADTTRVAAGDPDVWLPILLDNTDAVLASLDQFSEQLQSFRDALACGDTATLRRLWESRQNDT